jgi:hypothetical protein
MVHLHARYVEHGAVNCCGTANHRHLFAECLCVWQLTLSLLVPNRFAESICDACCRLLQVVG